MHLCHTRLQKLWQSTVSKRNTYYIPKHIKAVEAKSGIRGILTKQHYCFDWGVSNAMLVCKQRYPTKIKSISYSMQRKSMDMNLQWAAFLMKGHCGRKHCSKSQPKIYRFIYKSMQAGFILPKRFFLPNWILNESHCNLTSVHKMQLKHVNKKNKISNGHSSMILNWQKERLIIPLWGC